MATLMLTVATCATLYAESDMRVTNFGESNGFAESHITCIIQDSIGLIWLSTWDGLYSYDGYQFRNYKARPGDGNPLDINRIDYIRELPGGDILCRVTGNYFVFDRRQCKFHTYSGKREAHDMRYMPDSDTRRMVDGMERYSDIQARIMFKDRQGGIWVHSTLGLDRIAFVGKPIRNLMMGTGHEEEVRGLMEDRLGRLWVANKEGYVRLTARDGRSAAYITPAGTLSPEPRKFSPNVYCMHEDRHGTVWLGTKFNGLYMLTPDGTGYNVRHFVAGNPIDGHLNHNDIYSITEDTVGRIWIGTYGGGINVATVDKAGNVTFANSGNGMPSVHEGKVEIHRMAIIADSALLVGTNTGLYTARLERNTAAMSFNANRRAPHNASSLSNNRVTDIVATSRGDIFVATYGGGLCRLLSKELLSDMLRFKPITTDNGLGSDVVLSATEDDHGKLWLVSGASLSCLDPATDVITNFKRSLFSGGFVFSEAQPLSTADGRLVIGTTMGTLEFVPSELKKSNYVPPIVTNCGDSVDLKPHEKSLNIEIAAIDYNKNEQIEYAYKLDNVDSDWNYTTDNHIRYANIPAGGHTLRVRSTNGDGIWTDNERTITIRRTPHFHETPMAWMLYGGLVLIATYATVKIVVYIRKLRKEISNIKLTTNEKIEYVWLKSADRKGNDGKAAADGSESRGDKAWAEKVSDYMARNVANAELSVDSFAADMDMSRSALYLAMKRVFGVTPNTFIQDARIALAKELLKDRSNNVSDVAYKCGFSDPKYFSRCFKKATGKTPTEYNSGGCGKKEDCTVEADAAG